MGTIKASSAILDESKLLVQHQAALTLIQSILDNPELEKFRWLDLGCGKGQIIVNLDKNLNSNAISKIHYTGYDVKNEYLMITEKKANSLGIKSVDMKTGEISSFSSLVHESTKFDFITLTNTIHEFDPKVLSELFYELIVRLDENGCLFIYDMETLPDSKLELGAIPWKKEEMSEIFESFLKGIGIESYIPQLGKWSHNTCNGWNVNIQKRYFKVDNSTLKANHDKAITSTTKVLKEKLLQKYEECKNLLESITKYGQEVPNDEREKNRCLYDFWALSRAMEALK